MRGMGSISTEGNILSLDFFHSDANIGIIAIFGYLWKTRIIDCIQTRIVGNADFLAEMWGKALR